MTRKKIAEPKHKKATPIPVSKTAVAPGSRETTGATGGIIIIGEHIAKMWEASQKPRRSAVDFRLPTHWACGRRDGLRKTTFEV